MSSINKAAWMFCAATLVATPLFSAACSKDAAQSEEVGTLTMNLVATTAEGDTFRLRGAQFGVTSGGFEADVLTTEDDPDATSLSSDLPEGEYEVELRSGWYMEKLTDGAYEPVNAELTSAASQDVAISEGITTPVSYQFKAFGQLVALGGSLEITTEVIEELCTDDVAEDNDDINGAIDVLTDEVYAATICPYDDDYYSFIAPAGFFSVSLEFIDAEGDLDLEVYDENGALVAQSLSGSDNEGIDLESFPTATGYVRVLGYLAASNDYSLSFGSAPASWTCNDAWFNDGECDCGCGSAESDCDPATLPGTCGTVNCSGDEPYLDPDDAFSCTAAPPEWTCDSAWYSDSYCDCGCGAFDPICEGLVLPAECTYDTCGGIENVDPADPSQCLP